MTCATQSIQSTPIQPIPRCVPLAVSRSAEACRVAAAPPLGKECEFAYQQPGATVAPLPLTRDAQKAALEKRRRDAWERGRLAYLQMSALYGHGVQNEFKGLIKCGSRAIPKRENGKSPGHIQAQRFTDDVTGESYVGFSWAVKCKNPFFCFRCAPVIAAKKRREILENCRNLKEQGLSWLFITFTAPHDLNTDPGAQVETFNLARRTLKAGTPWKKFAEKYNYIGCVVANEFTDDHPDVPDNLKSGPHWHCHSIHFFDHDFTDEELAEFSEWLSKKWVYYLEKYGICSPENRESALKYGIKVEKPRDPQNSYTYKGGKTEEEVKADIDAAAEYVGKWAAFELAPAPAYKQGRREGSRVSHWEILRMAFSGERPELQDRAIQIMRALRTRHWIRWSKGLKGYGIHTTTVKDEVFLDPSEEEDDELMKGQNSDDVLYDYDQDSVEDGISWFEINRWRQARRLALAIEAAVSGDLFGEKMGATEACINFSRVVTEGCDPFTGEDFKTQYARGDPG